MNTQSFLDRFSNNLRMSKSYSKSVNNIAAADFKKSNKQPTIAGRTVPAYKKFNDTKNRCLHHMENSEIRHKSQNNLDCRDSPENERPRFVAVSVLEDQQAIRSADFHPSGQFYAIGSNSKALRICEYPSNHGGRKHQIACKTKVISKRSKYHKGSIYCVAWSADGNLIATGSNDKTVKLIRFKSDILQFDDCTETDLTMHDGTIRDVCFLKEGGRNKPGGTLISGGGGDCKIYVTDSESGLSFQALSGHNDAILSLHSWSGAVFVSGSQDKTIKVWDLRTNTCINTIRPITDTKFRTDQGSAVTSVCMDPSGRLLVSGHEDSACFLFDVRGNRPIQCFRTHAEDVRSIRFSPSAYYLLTAGYDNKLMLTDLQGDLTHYLPSVPVAYHTDKVITCRWHPHEFSFLSTSADRTATMWSLPAILF